MSKHEWNHGSDIVFEPSPDGEYQELSLRQGATGIAKCSFVPRPDGDYGTRPQLCGVNVSTVVRACPDVRSGLFVTLASATGAVSQNRYRVLLFIDPVVGNAVLEVQDGTNRVIAVELAAHLERGLWYGVKLAVETVGTGVEITAFAHQAVSTIRIPDKVFDASSAVGVVAGLDVVGTVAQFRQFEASFDVVPVSPRTLGW